MPKFGTRSESNLEGLHPDLLQVMRTAIVATPVDFMVIDGKRTLAEQKELVKKGASWTLKSRHLTGKAVDVMAYVNGTGRWEPKLYQQIGEHVLRIAEQLNIPLVWGGSWKVRDWGHFELDKNHYGY